MGLVSLQTHSSNWEAEKSFFIVPAVRKLILGSLERIVFFIMEGKVWFSSFSDCCLKVLEGSRLPLD